MSNITMSSDEMKFLSILANITNALARDCILDKNAKRGIFVVNPGDTGKIIGKGGATIRRVRESMQRDVEIVEYSKTLEMFTRNIFNPVRPKSVSVTTRNGKKIVFVEIAQNEKGRAIGKAGRVINRAKILLKRYFNIDQVILKESMEN